MMGSLIQWLQGVFQSPITETDGIATRTNNQDRELSDRHSNGKNKDPWDTLFGPFIGLISSGPSWATASEKKVLTDELTSPILKEWVRKSKDPSVPTTILQALVNLKRPSIRFCPISAEGVTSCEFDPHLHGLEFNFDCDAPRCGIYVYVFLPKFHPDSPPAAVSSRLSRILVFECVVDGGFEKSLTLEDGAQLKLGRYERIPGRTPSPQVSAPTRGADPVPDNVQVDGEGSSVSDPLSAPGTRSSRNRFSKLRFGRSSSDRMVVGPPLAVIYPDGSATANTETFKKKEENVDGVKVAIRLTALDEHDTELQSPNEQVTYLLVSRDGTRIVEEDDNRSWVVSVVKREATIGPHTFQLHEIFGLASTSDIANEHEMTMECSICLVDGREVIFLPCRHLVTCSTCARNLISVGAGEAISTTTDAAALGETGDNPVSANTNPPRAAHETSVQPTSPRRKPTGWLCPLCREPYIALLHISMIPSSDVKGEDDGPNQPDEMSCADSGTDLASGNPGILSPSITPSFLRNLSFGSRVPIAYDVENQNEGRAVEL